MPVNQSTPRALSRRLAVLAAGLLALAVLPGLVVPGLARGDGDPASDVLATQRLFVPADAGLTAAQQLQLAALVGEAARAGYPLRVAIIASGTDLGSVSALWRQPQNYAVFLGEELSLIARGPLLVVMPDGYGASVAGASDPAGLAALAAAPAPGRALGAAALDGVARLAAAAGHPLSVPRASAPAARSGSPDVVAWLVFALGAVLVALAWGASLHARPLGRPA